MEARVKDREAVKNLVARGGVHLLPAAARNFQEVWRGLAFALPEYIRHFAEFIRQANP